MLFKEVCENISEGEYRASERRSYSFFKELSERGPKAITDPKEALESAGLTLGSIVDKMLSDDLYEPTSEYTICDMDLDISGTTNPSKIVKYIYTKQLNLNREDPAVTDYLNNICEEVEIKRYPKFDDALWEQIELAKLKFSGTAIISSAELELAYKMADVFKTHEFTRDIFNPESGIEVINQCAIYFDVNNTECKSLLDKILVDHKNKIIKPYDIKTGSTKNFMSNFYGYKYYYQGSLYKYGLLQVLKNHPEFADYTIDPFRFIYLSREDSDTPIIYEMPDAFGQLVMNGYRSANGYSTKGIRELCDEYNWYISTGNYDYPMDITQSKGVVSIDIPVIVL